MQQLLPLTCPEHVVPNDNEGWLHREPTADEVEVAGWMRSKRGFRKVLHVGVGNCLLTRRFGAAVAQGISKDGREVAHAATLGLDVLLCNKYNVVAYRERLRSPFDLVVDVNIRSYACCDSHFRDYMSLMLDALNSRGILVTSTRGLDYLIPTSIAELQRLCPEWKLKRRGNIVTMRPRKSLGLLERLWWT